MVRHLLSLDYTSATVATDEGHTPLMIAADRAFESPSEVTELVMHMLQRAAADTSGTSPAVVNPRGAALGLKLVGLKLSVWLQNSHVLSENLDEFNVFTCFVFATHPGSQHTMIEKSNIH